MKKTASISAPVLMDEQSLYAAIIQSSGEAIISIDNNCTILTWNKAAEDLFGYEAEQVIGKSFSSIICSSCSKALSSVVNIIKETKSTENCEIDYHRKDGTPIHICFLLSPLYDPEKNMSGLCLIARNISDKKASEERLKISERNLKAIFDNASEGFVLLEPDGTIKALNGRANDSIVFSRDKTKPVIGQSVFDYVVPSRRETFIAIFDRVKAGESINLERNYETENNKENWFHFSFRPVTENDQVIAICVTGRNITEEKLSEIKLVKNEKRYKALVENSGDAVTILTPDGIPTYVSPSIKLILGYTEEEALKLNLFTMVHPEDAAEATIAWEKMLANPGVPTPGHTCRVTHKNGSWIWIESIITNMLHDPDVAGIVDNFRDVNQKIEAGNQIKISEERYRHLFYNNPQSMWIYDFNTLKFLDINKSAIINYGYSREEFLEMSLLDIRSAEETSKVLRAVKNLPTDTFNNSGIWEHKTKNGKKLIVEITSHKMLYENKEAVLILSNDITEKKKATELLLKSYQENNNILESITDGFFAVNRDLIVTYWNKEAERILNMPRTGIIGKNLWDVYRTEIDLKFYSEYKRALEEQVAVRFEEFFPPLSIWLDVTVYPSDIGLSIYFKDITQQRIAIDRIKKANERYEMVASATNDVIYEWDILENVNYWNENFHAILGHEKTEIMPVSSWLENLHPEEAPRLLARNHEAMINKETSLTRELRFKCADGSYKIFNDKLIIVYDEEKKPIKIMGAMQDITERKKHETAIIELNEQLNNRAGELGKSNEELERFAYVASHDLQEPLRMVSSFLQLLQKKYQAQLDDTANQYINYAVDGADRMKKLILDLLEYSRIGTNEEEIVDTDLNEVLSSILTIFSDRITKTKAKIVFDKMPVVRANRMQITQLIQNLVSNSLKYNESEIPEIEIKYEEKPQYWQFSVRDNGIGIDKKFLDKVFIIFQRLHNKNKYSGTGIGLAICKKIVEKHGGRIWIEPAPETGTVFLFTIKK